MKKLEKDKKSFYGLKNVFNFAIFILLGSMCVGGMGLEVLSEDCEVGTDVVITQSLNGEGIRISGGSYYYVPGSMITVTISFVKTSASLYALGLECLIPTGWKYLGLLSGSYNPQVYPETGTVSNGENPLGFAWINANNLPQSFNISFEVEVPESESSQVSIVSRGLYRLTGGQICTNTETTIFVGPYSTNEGGGEGGQEGFIEGDNQGGEGFVEGDNQGGEGGGEGFVEGDNQGGEGGGEGFVEGEGEIGKSCGGVDINIGEVKICGGDKGIKKEWWKFLADFVLVGIVLFIMSGTKGDKK